MNQSLESSIDVCWLSNVLPRHNATSAGLRIFELVKLMADLRQRQIFFYWQHIPHEEQYKKDLWQSALCRHLPHNLAAPALVKALPRQLWITNIWTVEYLKYCTVLIPVLRQLLPELFIVLDTMDFHAKKYFRAYQANKNPDSLVMADQFLTWEKKVYPLADMIAVVTQEEADDLRSSIPQLPEVRILPNIVRSETRPVSTPTPRKNLVFIGNYSVTHNLDGVNWFIDHVLPHIRAEDPEVQLHLVGMGAENYYQNNAAAGIVVKGFVEDLQKALAPCHVFVCPLTYGAGMKGKIGSAFAHGLPVVTTTTGTEGFTLRPGEDALVEDDPQAFAAACLRLLREDALWQTLSLNGWEVLRRLDGEGKAHAVLAEILGNKYVLRQS